MECDANITCENANNEKKSFFDKVMNKKKQLIIVGIIIACVLVSCILFNTIRKSGRYTILHNQMDCTFFGAEEGLFYNWNGDILDTDISSSSVWYSPGYVIALTVDEEDNGVYILKKNGEELLDEDISNIVFSDDGDSIAYVKDKEGDFFGDLYVYTVSSGKKTKIDTDVYFYHIILSPNGKTVAYIKDAEINQLGNEIGDIYVSVNLKKGEKRYKKSQPIAVSDGGKYVYYIKEREKLYMNDTKISSSYDPNFIFNENYKELLFNEDGELYYFTVNSNDAKRLKKEKITDICMPENTKKITYNSLDFFSKRVRGVDTFNNTVLEIDNSLYYMTKKGEELEKITDAFYTYQIAQDGNSLLYLDENRDLVYISDLDKSREGICIGEDLEIDEFKASSDLKKVYYVSDDELFWLKDGEATRISDVDSWLYSDKYGVVYFIDDDELFYATKNVKSKKKIMGETVQSMSKIWDEISFTFEEDDEKVIYLINGKGKYKKIIQIN